MWLILNDEAAYETYLYPTHTIGKKGELIKVFIGDTHPEGLYKGIGIYILDEDYEKMDHSKGYMLIHDPEITQDKIPVILEDSRNQFPDFFELEIKEDIIDRDHMHIQGSSDEED